MYKLVSKDDNYTFRNGFDQGPVHRYVLRVTVQADSGFLKSGKPCHICVLLILVVAVIWDVTNRIYLRMGDDPRTISKSSNWKTNIVKEDY